MKRAPILAAVIAGSLLPGCTSLMCGYLTGVRNDSLVSYHVRETGALIPPGGQLTRIHYKLSGDERQEVLHLDPVRYYRTANEWYPLVTPQERAAAFAAWQQQQQQQGGAGYSADPEAWFRDFIGGTIVLQHRHSYNPWGGPSWTELAGNSLNSSTTEIQPALFHVRLRVKEDRMPVLTTEWGVCP